MKKAYPQIDDAKILHIPHKVTYLPSRLPRVKISSQLRIGIVGNIGFHKGALVVKALANEIKARGIDLKIVIIGTIDVSCDPSVVSQTGSYKHEEMPNLIERAGVNVMLFPSIWPETFSYVVQELIDMDLPVASFDFGAPAERLNIYSKGLVLDSFDPSRVLDNLTLFHRKIYLPH